MCAKRNKKNKVIVDNSFIDNCILAKTGLTVTDSIKMYKLVIKNLEKALLIKNLSYEAKQDIKRTLFKYKIKLEDLL